jgi:hypothetical protein
MSMCLEDLIWINAGIGRFSPAPCAAPSLTLERLKKLLFEQNFAQDMIEKSHAEPDRISARHRTNRG